MDLKFDLTYSINTHLSSSMEKGRGYLFCAMSIKMVSHCIRIHFKVDLQEDKILLLN